MSTEARAVFDTGKLGSYAMPPAGWWRHAWRVWVVFDNNADMWLCRYLQSGFRHCYVLYHDGNTWVSLDPTANYLDVSVHGHLSADFDLPNWLRSHGYTVIPARLRRGDKRPFHPAPFTCVEMAKRFLGLRSWRTVTPFQLYKRLMADIQEENKT